MKRFLSLVLFVVVAAITMNAQVTISGNVVKANTEVVAKDTKTTLLYEDSKGNKYPIYISAKGACYIIRVSKNTGKQYKQYLNKEVTAAIKKQLKL